MPPTAPASSSVSVAIEIAPVLVGAPDTLRAAKFVPMRVRLAVPLLTKEFAVTERTRRLLLPISSLPVLVSAPANRQGRAARAVIFYRRRRRPLLVSDPVVDTEAPSRRSRIAGDVQNRPVKALFDPSAVLSSTKALFAARVNCERAAIVVICPVRNSIAETLVEIPRFRSTFLRRPIPALPVTSRSAWLAPEPVRSDVKPVLSSDAAVTLSDAESVVLPMTRWWRGWSGSPPPSGSIRHRRRWGRDRRFRHWPARRSSTPRPGH